MKITAIPRCTDGKFRYIYKITCLEGSWKGKFYYGQHTTDYLADGYFSSGKKINDYKKKYPYGCLREIISFHASEESLNKAEYDIIHPYLGTKDCLNLKEGGNRGTYTDEAKQKMSNSMKGRTAWNKGKQWSDEIRNKIKENSSHHTPWNKGLHSKSGMEGKHHTDETRLKISASKVGQNKGVKPKNTGKHRVYDNIELNIYHYE